MKRFIYIFLSLFVTATASAQTHSYNEVSLFEGEVGFGISTAGKVDGSAVTTNFPLFLEGRYNIPNSPFDVGLQGYIGAYNRKNEPVAERNSNMHIMPRLLSVYGDYNFRRGRRVSLFGGVGLGYALVINQGGFSNTARERYFAFSPRLGAEFFNRVRLTVEYKVIPDDNSLFGVNFGFVFGGGLR